MKKRDNRLKKNSGGFYTDRADRHCGDWAIFSGVILELL